MREINEKTIEKEKELRRETEEQRKEIKNQEEILKDFEESRINLEESDLNTKEELETTITNFDEDNIYNEEEKIILKRKISDYNREVEKENAMDNARISFLEENLEREDISEGQRNKMEKELSVIRERVDSRTQGQEVTQESISLRDRVKAIFKKYGFTVTAVITSVGVVIGVIVSNLSSGLSKIAKGVGNGFKEIGAKLAQILPGMIGAIASFIFRTAGEVVGFLAKNAWLLILAVVAYFVQSLKKKRR